MDLVDTTGLKFHDVPSRPTSVTKVLVKDLEVCII